MAKLATVLIGVVICALQWHLPLGCGNVFGQQPAPLYLAEISEPSAIVYSGPGETHYGTDRLGSGTVIRVFREDPGGWLAIQPPQGAFSLVRRDAVKPLPNGLAQVISQDAVAWVGTRLGPAEKPLWQVKLRPGEILDVLGAVDREQYGFQEQDPDWIQIRPPGGEFRWIKSSDLRRINNQPDASAEHRPGNSSAEASEPGRLPKSPVPFESWQSDTANPWEIRVESNSGMPPANEAARQSTDSNAAAGWKPARQTIANFTERRSGFDAEGLRAADDNLWDPNHPPTAPRTVQNIQGSTARSPLFDSEDSVSVGGPSLNLSGPEFYTGLPTGNISIATSQHTDLVALQMRLTQELIKSPENWQLDQLAADAESVRARIQSPDDIRFLDRINQKIRNCRLIQANFRATSRGPGFNQHSVPSTFPSLTTKNDTTNVASSPGLAANANSAPLNHFDASGVLNELVRNGGLGQSTYVLQTPTGEITHHVAAPPGVNLRRYLHQPIGIIGNRGYHQELGLNHVSVERVVPLSSIRR